MRQLFTFLRLAKKLIYLPVTCHIAAAYKNVKLASTSVRSTYISTISVDPTDKDFAGLYNGGSGVSRSSAEAY